MMKTRINYTKDVNKGKSIYDYFAKDELLDTFVTYASRHFKRDSFYHYSTPVQIGAIIKIGSITNQIKSAKEFIEHFETQWRGYDTHDYWLESTEEDKEYTGYNEELKNNKYILNI